MVAPLMAFTNCCCGKTKLSDGSKDCNLGDKLVPSALAFDTLLFISALVIGILGVASVIAMPAAAAYGLIGASGGIALLWIAAVIKQRTCANKHLPCFVPDKKGGRKPLVVDFK